MRGRETYTIVALISCLISLPAFASGDVEAGKRIFRRCKVCHLVDKEKHKTGPHLVNIIGRPAGTVEGYKRYSKAMKNSGIVWNEETLDGYLKKPKDYVKGTRMLFVGLKKEADRANLISYLTSYSNQGVEN